jgi:hypothetical protein
MATMFAITPTTMTATATTTAAAFAMTTATTAAVTTATAAFTLGASFGHGYGTTIKLRTMELVHGFAGFFFRGHFNKAKAATFAAKLVHDDVH